MKLLGTTIEINRGETFTLSRNVVNRNGVPYILPALLVNPYLLITVSSNTYCVPGMWKKNYWLDLKSFPKFVVLEPVPVQKSIIIDNTPPIILGAVYYYVDDVSNEKSFYRYDDTTLKYKSYNFRFDKLFINNDTSEWIESIYKYEIRIVSGELMLKWLQNIFIGQYPDVPVPEDKSILYNQICKISPELLKNIDYTQPLVNFYTKHIIQQNAKLIIKTNI